jgi:polysaccharide chain length determinant protein (PEP-CTERM system associated)
MLNLSRPVKPEDYLATAWRRKWWILIPFVLVSAAGIAVTLNLPKTYRSSTLILLVPQRVPTEYVRSTVTSTIEEQIQSLNTQIMSRTNLLSVVQEFGLYREELRKMSQEEIVEVMRKNIQIELKGGPREKKEAFELFFAGEDPKTVMMVTNRLASLFIEQNLKMRESQAEGTASFLADQLKRTEADLEKKEKEITAFKSRYMGELPEQMQANLGVLQQLQLQHQRISDSIRSAEDRKVLYTNQVTELKRFSSASRPEDSSLPPEVAPSGGRAAAERETAEERLATLLAKYTEKHPDVVALKKRVEEMKREAEERPPQGTGAGREAGRTRRPVAPTSQTDAMIANVQAQLASVDSEIRHLRIEEEKVKARIREYEQRIENAPKIEQEMTNLTRDYENMKKLYESLLSKKLDSEQAKAMEQRQQGQQFRILDPAQLPTKPWKPDMMKLLALSVALGLGAGCGLALLVEYKDRSFKDPEDLGAFTGLSVIAVVPRIEPDLDKGGSAGKVQALSGGAPGRRVRSA